MEEAFVQMVAETLARKLATAGGGSEEDAPTVREGARRPGEGVFYYFSVEVPGGRLCITVQEEL